MRDPVMGVCVFIYEVILYEVILSGANRSQSERFSGAEGTPTL